MPSTYEGVGISAMEAMFCGIPCLLTDVDGLRDFKELQCDEIYYCNLNEESFNSEIMYLYTKWIEQQLQHSEKLANITRKKYDMEKSVKEYLKYINSNINLYRIIFSIFKIVILSATQKNS